MISISLVRGYHEYTKGPIQAPDTTRWIWYKKTDSRTSVGSNRKIPNLEPPEPLVNRTSNLPNLFLDFKTEPNLKRPNLEPLLILK